MSDRQIPIETNTGIAASGDYARITQNIFQVPDAVVPPAEQVACRSRVVHLGTTGRAGAVFVGRDDELRALDAVSPSASPPPGPVSQVLTGLGGIGKSSLAREYARRHRADYNPIWWIAAEDSAGLETGLAALARRLCPQLALVPQEAASDWARTWLGTHFGWLLLLDNVAGPDDVAELIADVPGGRFLITSRTTSGWSGIAAPVRLGVLADEQAVELIRCIAGEALLDGVEELCQTLGSLPLAVEQAARYMEQNQVTASVFLRRLTAGGGRVMAWTPDGGDPQRTIARIWQVSLDRITARHGELPLRLLRILAWFAPDDIPVSVLHRLEGLDEEQVDEALGRLGAYGLITRAGDAVMVHRLVQAVARASVGPGTDADAPSWPVECRQAVSAVRLALHALPFRRDPADWPAWRRLMPHVDALVGHIDPDDDDENVADILVSASWFLHGQGSEHKAIRLVERALDGHERTLGPDHPDTLIARSNLINYQSLGKYSQVIPLLEQALTDWDRVLGPEHPDTLTARCNLATAYTSAGDSDKAISLHERVLAERERILGADHPDTLISRNNLADALESAGDRDRAIVLYEKVLGDRERVLGPDHPDVLTSRRSLAATYNSAGDLDRALPMLEQTLVDQERLLGPDHPDTLLTRDSLADVWESSAQPDRAVALLRQNVAHSEQILGPDHPTTLIRRNSLAQAYEATGDLDRALPLLGQVLSDRERVFGPDHPDTLDSYLNLADACVKAGDLDQAITLFRQLVSARERVHGPDDPLALASRNHLAIAYEAAGDLEEAIRQHRRTLTDCERVFGPEHENTLISRNVLANAYDLAGDADLALLLYRHTLEICERALEADHPTTVFARRGLERLRAIS